MPTSDTAAMLLHSALAADAARPFVTFYDDETAERVELSVATYANWVAKTANLLQDDLGLQTGGTVALLLPLHWQVPVWSMASWLVGASVMLGATDADLRDVDVVVTGPGSLERAMASGAEVVHLRLRPALLAARERQQTPLPASVLDADTEIAGHGDRFVANEESSATALALTSGSDVFDATELTAYAQELAVRWGAGAGARLLTTAAPDDVDGLCAALVIPLVLGGSAVLVAHADVERLAAKQESERVSVVHSE